MSPKSPYEVLAGTIYMHRECSHIKAVRQMMWKKDVTVWVSIGEQPQMKCRQCHCVADLTETRA